MKTVAYKVVDSQGKEVGNIDLDASVFGGEIFPEIVHQVVRWQRAKARAGTHSSLTKGMMKGGNRKPWKQKGTGMARSGSNTSPLWVGGAKAHGPQPRSYEFRLSKRSRKQALVSVLTEKVNNSKLVVLDELAVKKGKTKEILSVLKGLGLCTKKVSIVLPEREDLTWRSSANLKNVCTLSASGVNVYDLLKYSTLVSTKAGIKALEKRVKGEESNKE